MDGIFRRLRVQCGFTDMKQTGITNHNLTDTEVDSGGSCCGLTTVILEVLASGGSTAVVAPKDVTLETRLATVDPAG